MTGTGSHTLYTFSFTVLAAQGLNLAKFTGVHLSLKHIVAHTRVLLQNITIPFHTTHTHTHTHTHTERRIYVTVAVGNTRKKTKVHEEDKYPPQWTGEEFVL